VEQEKFYKNLLDNLNDGVYFVDLNRRITYWNQGAERLTGYHGQEMIGHNCAENILGHMDEEGNNLCRGRCPLVRAMQSGGKTEFEIYMLSVRWKFFQIIH
jgi:PAS domain S-box-containing protein